MPINLGSGELPNQPMLNFHFVVFYNLTKNEDADQGCISCGILVSEIRARGVSSEHMENMKMFSCSPT